MKAIIEEVVKCPKADEKMNAKNYRKKNFEIKRK